jgi:catechol 2,3-dioxygenase-like lactoylglutathione lyase family enzyme
MNTAQVLTALSVILIAQSLCAAPLPANGTPPGAMTNEEQALEIKPVGLAHVALWTMDIENYVAFYRDFLGFPEKQRGNKVPGAPNVYYLRDGTPESLAKEKQGSLFMVKLKTGDDGQSIELFPARSPIVDGKSMYHFAVGFEDQEPVRRALHAISAKAPPEPATKGFFTYDKNKTCTEILKSNPRDPMKTNSTSKSSVSSRLLFVEISGENPADMKTFYVDTLNFRETAPASVRLDIGPYGEYVVLNPKVQTPRIGYEVQNLEEALAFLEKSPWRTNYKKPIEIVTTDGKRHIVLEDPEGVRIELWERPLK